MNSEEILKDVDKIKISIIMQVNLKTYPGSRSDADRKFTRAVDSFKNQIYKNAELIIVSDGCTRAHQLYNRTYLKENNIKFIYLDRNETPQMYQDMGEGKKYFRGFARGLGSHMATGTIVTYMDSDDYLLPEFTMTLMLIYNTSPEKDWWINTSWYDHANVDNSIQNKEILEDPKEIESIEIKNLPGSWKAMKTKNGKMMMAPWIFAHKVNCNIKWRDVISTNVSEDVDFYNRFSGEYPNGTVYSRPIYARCHMAGFWDI